MDVSDAILVKRFVQQGDQQAFTEIVQRYEGLVFGLIRGVVGSVSELEDLVQETFIEGYLKLGILRDAERVGPWLCRVAQNRAKMWLRSRKRTEGWKGTSDTFDEVHDLPLIYSPDISGEEAGGQVWEALGQLSYNNRIVTLLYYVDGYSQTEIAHFLGVSEVTVRQRLCQARKRLRETYPRMMKRPPKRQNTPSEARHDRISAMMKKGETQMKPVPTILEKVKIGEEVHLTADEAKAYGLVDQIVTRRE